jgi:hypothetical protein
MVATSIFFIGIIASKARFAPLPPAARAPSRPWHCAELYGTERNALEPPVPMLSD